MSQTHPHVGKRRSITYRTLRLTLMAVLVLALFEGALRLQQKLGPWIDLKSVGFAATYPPSNYLNHVVDIERTNPPTHDKYGIRLNPNRPAPETLSHPARVLFLGDSFMMGATAKSTIPQFVYEEFRRTEPDREFAFYNAGCTSYSVFNYIIQARVLPRMLQPEAVIVDIDETDLANDYFGRELVIRDYLDEVVAYRAYYKDDLLRRLNRKIKSTPLYIKRLIDRILTTELIFSTLDELYGREVTTTNLDRFFFVSRKAEDQARREDGEAIDLFRRNVTELVVILKREMPDPRRIVLAMHAHQQHFKPIGGEKQWNRIAAGIAGEVCREQGILFYDGFPEMQQAFGDSPEDFYYENDMHLNPEGLQIFSRGLATFMARNEVL